MKSHFDEPRFIFSLLMGVSLVAIVLGTYLCVALGMQVQASVTALSAVGILLWAVAWGAFMAMCNRLRKGESAFTPATERTLRIIGWCMVALAAVTVVSAAIGTSRTDYWLIEFILVPGIFLAAGVAAKILRGLLSRAMALEEEQEGVV